METKAAITFWNGEPFEITEIKIDEPKAGEVLIRLVGTGIFHTDILAQNQAYPVPLPAVLGHEGGGVVEKVGLGITHIEPGDDVDLDTILFERNLNGFLMGEGVPQIYISLS
ncbi:alcohol dehydrogenase catalytic domain-containing protein [Peribacillus glennii]|uniref:Alcohol dehydrogenase-like N-terminal domain-containing protein n=1 Tax=Peribacillus glennii TaxID=2303991 RepID=A0A372LD16_9BACI|nr:alcohol dehydrogenase catalytic domain-containing protein [Peribacillus glennii]RFU62974.1 hypothetical protein D0466_13605 [Peribacillus glennii]